MSVAVAVVLLHWWPGKATTSQPTQFAMTPQTGTGGNGAEYTISGSPNIMQVAVVAVAVVISNSAGGTNNHPFGWGGRGGGGNGGGNGDNASPGDMNTGGEGGGEVANNQPSTTANHSGAGGSGVVIIAYPPNKYSYIYNL